MLRPGIPFVTYYEAGTYLSKENPVGVDMYMNSSINRLSCNKCLAQIELVSMMLSPAETAGYIFSFAIELWYWCSMIVCYEHFYCSYMYIMNVLQVLYCSCHKAVYIGCGDRRRSTMMKLFSARGFYNICADWFYIVNRLCVTSGTIRGPGVLWRNKCVHLVILVLRSGRISLRSLGRMGQGRRWLRQVSAIQQK